MKGTAAMPNLASVQGTPRPCIYMQCSIYPQTSDVTLQGITKDFGVNPLKFPIQICTQGLQDKSNMHTTRNTAAHLLIICTHQDYLISTGSLATTHIRT